MNLDARDLLQTANVCNFALEKKKSFKMSVPLTISRSSMGFLAFNRQYNHGAIFGTY